MKLLDHVMLLLRTDARAGTKTFVSDDTKALAEAVETRMDRLEDSLATALKEIRAIRQLMRTEDSA